MLLIQTSDLSRINLQLWNTFHAYDHVSPFQKSKVTPTKWDLGGIGQGSGEETTRGLGS